MSGLAIVEPLGPDTELPLHFDVNALCVAETIAGATTGEIVAGLSSGLDMRSLRALLVGGLSKSVPNVDPQFAGGVIERMGVPAASAAVIKALAEAPVLRHVDAPEKAPDAKKAGKGKRRAGNG